uniref:Peptidase S54 rhomboid domain-containing protein n=1 Tax=Megaselia scalaris TaxID=36166 RepID=T1GC75_MEGSC
GGGLNISLDKNLKVDPAKYQEVWRYFTYAFVHADIEHLLFNIFAELITGWILEKTSGWWKIGILFGISIISGSLTTFITNKDLVGSSAVFYSFIAAGFVHFFFIIITLSIYNYIVEELDGWIAHLAGFVIGAIFSIVSYLIDINNN